MTLAAGAEADARRAQIAERLADHVLAHGLAASTLRPMARAAGLSDRMLLYYFPDKAAAVSAALNALAARMMAMLPSQFPTGPMPLDQAEVMLRRMVLDDAVWPYMQIWLELAQQASRGDAVVANVAQRLGEGFLAWGESLLLGEGEARTRDAARLLMLTEGAMVLHAIGLNAALARLD